MITIFVSMVKYWLIAEFINWISYLFIYIKIIGPKFLKFKENDTIKIIERIDRLNKNEIEHVISGCIVYNKLTHSDVDHDNFNIKNMSKVEIIN